MPAFRSLAPRAGAAAALASVLALAVPTAAQAACTQQQLPAIEPVAQVHAGEQAYGKTVVSGTTPVDFDVTILGTVPDGIAPGIDLILFQASGPVIQASGGIAMGFSGSPVYDSSTGALIGAVSYGPPGGYGDPTIGGITPASAMADVTDYAPGPIAHRALRGLSHPAARVQVPARLAAASGSSPTLRPLAMPLAVSGLGGASYARVRRVLSRHGVAAMPYRAASAAGTTPASGPALAPGDSIAAAISYGDVTLAGIGTTTFACGDQAVAFGHPFFLAGRTTLGMNGADVLGVVADPSGLMGAYKVANVGDLHGSIDQDRLAGIRGIEGRMPELIPVTTSVRDADTERSRDGETDVVRRNCSADGLCLPLIAAVGLSAEQAAIFDQVGGGTVESSFVIRGTTPSGSRFVLTRRDAAYSPDDAPDSGVDGLYRALTQLTAGRLGHARISSVHADATLTEGKLTTAITSVRTASSLMPRLAKHRTLVVLPGDVVRVRVGLRPRPGNPVRRLDLLVRVPRHGGSFGYLAVGGGAGAAMPRPHSFRRLLASIHRAPQGSDVAAQLRLFGHGRFTGAPVSAPAGAVVTGGTLVRILVAGGARP